MKKRRVGENMVIGLIDGLTVPFALAAGLTSVLTSTYIIFVCCISVTILFSLVMTISAKVSVQKYDPSQPAIPAAFIVGLSYLAGGLLTSFPFILLRIPADAMKVSVAFTLPALLIAGYVDSNIHGASAISGSLRAGCTAIIAAAGTYGVAQLFR